MGQLVGTSVVRDYGHTRRRCRFCPVHTRATGGWSASFNQAYQVLDDVRLYSTYRIGGRAKAHYSPALNPVSILLCRTNGAFGFVPYSPAVTFTLEGLWQFL